MGRIKGGLAGAAEADPARDLIAVANSFCPRVTLVVAFRSEGLTGRMYRTPAGAAYADDRDLMDVANSNSIFRMASSSAAVSRAISEWGAGGRLPRR